MKKTLQTFRYLFRSYVWMTCIGFLSILGGAAITDLVFQLTNRHNAVQQVVTLSAPFEITAGIFAFLTGLLLFIANFKVALANGISRKTFLLANFPIAVIAAVALSIFNMAALMVHGLFWPIELISSLIYPHTAWGGSLLLQFALFLLLIVVGWTITLTYYRCNVPTKWIVSLAPLMLIILVQQVNAQSGGAVKRAIGDYLHMSMGTPYMAALFMLAYSVILYGLIYLLIRRAPLKD